MSGSNRVVQPTMIMDFRPLTCTDMVSEGESPLTYMPAVVGELVLEGRS